MWGWASYPQPGRAGTIQVRLCDGIHRVWQTTFLSPPPCRRDACATISPSLPRCRSYAGRKNSVPYSSSSSPSSLLLPLLRPPPLLHEYRRSRVSKPILTERAGCLIRAVVAVPGLQPPPFKQCPLLYVRGVVCFCVETGVSCYDLYTTGPLLIATLAVA